MDSDSFYSDPQNFFSAVSSGLPRPSSYPSATEVRRTAHERSSDIFKQWTTLHEALKRHEEVIRRRWLKKRQDQRKAILLDAWPNMPLVHRPDFLAFKKETPEQRNTGTQHRDAYLWPYVNVEDLAQGKTLLLFLNSRGRHLPDAFAHADYDAAHLGLVSLAIPRPFLNGYTMLFSGQTTPETYGELVAWDDDDRAFDWMISGIGMQPAEGLQILEIQQKVLCFLVKCCRLILHDLPPSLIDQGLPVEHQLPPISLDPNTWHSLGNIAAEAPYRVPAHLDLNRLIAMIAAKRSAAKDHLWALREDPSYFADAAGDLSEHRQETLRDDYGKQHPIVRRPLFWDRVLGNLVVNAYGSFATWDGLYGQITKIKAMDEQYSETISAGGKLRPEYSDALQYFKFYLVEATKGPINQLKVAAPASPPLRSLFVREPVGTEIYQN